MGRSPTEIAAKLDARITPAQVRAWSAGDARVWALETFAIARRDAYDLPTRPTCGQNGAITLSPAYQATAEADAAQQLSVAGIRLAFVLNTALGGD